SDLVSDHLQRAAKLQMLFEEGTKIAGASSYSSLERQMSSTISRLRGEKVDVKIYYSESLFSGKNSSAFYLSLEGNQPDFSKQLTVDSGNKSNEYIYINSTRGEGVAAVMELPVPPGY